MQRYNKNKDGLPLVPYTPDPADRIPVPRPPLDELYANVFPSCDWEQRASNKTDDRDGIPVEMLDGLLTVVRDTINNWNEKAMATGRFENAYLVWCPDLYGFVAVYERLATIPEIINIKARAQEELKWRDSVLSEMDKRYKAARDILGEE